MFDVGFSEVLLIFVIALIVLGPEKLPKAASQVGRWIGRARAMARQFKEQLEEEVNLENVRKAHKEAAAKEEKDGVAGSTASDASAGATADMAASADAGGSASTTTSTEPGAQPQLESSVGTTIPPEAYTGPDPTEFRADTFSHAHPTNEYGANPLTPNGAPEDLMRPSTNTMPETSHAGTTHAEPSAESAHRANGSDAPASSKPAAAPSTHEPAHEPAAATAAQTDNHGNS